MKEGVFVLKVLLIFTAELTVGARMTNTALMEYRIISVSRTEPKQDGELEIKRTPHSMLPC